MSFETLSYMERNCLRRLLMDESYEIEDGIYKAVKNWDRYGEESSREAYDLMMERLNRKQSVVDGLRQKLGEFETKPYAES